MIINDKFVVTHYNFDSNLEIFWKVINIDFSEKNGLEYCNLNITTMNPFPHGKNNEKRARLEKKKKRESCTEKIIFGEEKNSENCPEDTDFFNCFDETSS